tara:strand:- start:301 stop:2007 length:1707 start_codon:yes stop_codon:yes gene_type:complete
MAFQLSPGVLVTEKDLTSVVPQVATTAGAFAGDFQWGPVDQVVTVNSENDLVSKYGKPNDTNFVSFFTAANFLAYGNNLQLVRSIGAAARNARANTLGTAVRINNSDVYEATYNSGSAALGEWTAKYPGTLGNSLKVSIADANSFSSWAYTSSFTGAPSTSTSVAAMGGSLDEMHVIVIDEDGLWTGTAGSVLERFEFVSKASNGKRDDGTKSYYKDVINQQSKYILWTSHNANVVASSATVAAWGTQAAGIPYANLLANATLYSTSVSLSGGVDAAPTAGNIQSSLGLFSNDEQYNVSLMPMGAADAATINYATQSIAEVRKDMVVFASPPSSAVVNNAASPSASILSFRDTLTSSSYAFLDSGWKYQYDRYNDTYRYVPLNGDTAGITARSDYSTDPWFSPAGFTRGQVKNVVKLSYSPTKTDRDNLYNLGVNPVVAMPGQGVVLFGDKTLLAKPSAFDRINVRRLFIVLEKAIATAAKYQLFEFNDGFTRAQFKNLVEPFLRDVKGRRGLTDYKVVCDETNNTGEVIDRNEFVADIYIKPARSINFIQLNFIATRSGIAFETVGA